jgi:hypothetical protein
MRFEKPYDVMRVAKHVVQLGEQWRSWRMSEAKSGEPIDSQEMTVLQADTVADRTAASIC